VNLGALLAAGGDVTGGRIELRRAITTPVRFSSEQVVRSAALRYLQLAITAPMDSVELVFAADLAGRIAASNPQDPSLRFLVLALELRGGRQDARTEIERIEREARAANAAIFADEVASFLRSLPQAG
jgi:hypothetical protein